MEAAKKKVPEARATSTKKPGKNLSRGELTDLYRAMHEERGTSASGRDVTVDPSLRARASAAALLTEASGAGPVRRQSKRSRGSDLAIMTVLLFGALKIGFSILEASEVGQISDAVAVAPIQAASVPTGPVFSEAELDVLSRLDDRRVELEKRREELTRRVEELDRKEREFVIRLSELRELSGRLRMEREQGEKRKNVEVDQLANVYGSMDPREAAPLIEQLDITIALDLIKRMPEKRIGQILSLMSSEKALMLTKLLSGRATS